jgi:hypothetical protein
MSNFKVEIQIPSGKLIDVTPNNGMSIIKGLLDGTDYVPELVTTRYLTAKTTDGKTIQILLSPVDGFQPIVENLIV